MDFSGSRSLSIITGLWSLLSQEPPLKQSQSAPFQVRISETYNSVAGVVLETHGQTSKEPAGITFVDTKYLLYALIIAINRVERLLFAMEEKDQTVNNSGVTKEDEK